MSEEIDPCICRRCAMACNLCGTPTTRTCPAALAMGIESPTKKQIDAYCADNNILTFVALKQTV